MARPHRRHRRPDPPAETVELRVHGAGGATPEELLDMDATELVAGDESAGFFRPAVPTGSSTLLEGYTWGGLTSAARARALWVLLLPFALINVAGWMLRHGGDALSRTVRSRTALETTAVGLIRVSGLAITLAVVAIVAEGAIGLIGYQCGGMPGCGDRWWLAPWGNRWVSGDVGRSVVVGAVATAFVVLGVGWLTRRSQVVIHGRPFESSRIDPALRVGLRRPDIWDSPHVAHRLGLLHVAGALGAIGVTVSSTLENTGSGPLWAIAGGWGLVMAALAVCSRLEGTPFALPVVILAVAVVYLAAVCAMAWLGAAVAAPGGRMPIGSVLAGALLPATPTLVLLAGVAVTGLRAGHRASSLSAVLMPVALLTAAAAAAGAFGSAFLIGLGDLLDTASYPIVQHEAVADVAVASMLAVIILLALAVGVRLTVRGGPSCGDLSERYAHEGGLDCDDPEDAAWARRVAGAHVTAGLTDRAGDLVVATIGLLVVFLGAAVWWGSEDGIGLGSWAEPMATPASVALGAVPLVVVVMVGNLYRSRALRRTVGVLWDVATYWPRWFHPWAPPSYGERAVAQLSGRLDELSGGEGVILSAHSQGSVLALSTLAIRSSVENVALLTHGSPLRRLHARYFPEYFSTELFTELASSVTGWTNLWRRTDYAGGPIGTHGVVDVEMADPAASRPSRPGDPRPLPRRHSDYDREQPYRDALSELARRMH